MSAQILPFPRRLSLTPLAEARPGDRVFVASSTDACAGVVERRVRTVSGILLHVRMTGGDFPGSVRAVRVLDPEAQPDP